MDSYFDYVLNGRGEPVVGASVAVKLNGVSAPIYFDELGTQSAPNPMTTDANGHFLFYAANGDYTLTITYDGQSVTLDGVKMYDGEAQSALLARAVFCPTGEASLELPSAASRSNKYFVFDSSGNPTIASAPSDSANYASTSTTSLLIGTGSKSLTTGTGKFFSVGAFIILASAANPANYMLGQVTAYNSTTGAMTVNVSSVGGSGTLADWVISIAVGSAGVVYATGATFTGLITTKASATGGAGFNIPAGVAPTSPVNGDLWTTSAALYARINAVTYQVATLAGTETLTNKTVNLTSNTLTGTTAQFNTALSDGDFATLAGTETLTNKTLTAINAASSLSDTGTIATDSIGFRGIPQNAKTAVYTLALTDNGKHISITTGGVIIPANSSIAFPIGAVVAIYNDSAVSQTISITSDTLRQAGTASTGSRTLAQYGLATLVKVAATTWVISGAGLS